MNRIKGSFDSVTAMKQMKGIIPIQVTSSTNCVGRGNSVKGPRTFSSAQQLQMCRVVYHKL